jgi:hypothetical protein
VRGGRRGDNRPSSFDFVLSNEKRTTLISDENFGKVELGGGSEVGMGVQLYLAEIL